ncbi:MAG: hypothetical protein QOC84_1026 [Bradyrhizobium sp.]|nr:hypothetical protein [Bradyrhizobium sp.]
MGDQAGGAVILPAKSTDLMLRSAPLARVSKDAGGPSCCETAPVRLLSMRE